MDSTYVKQYISILDNLTLLEQANAGDDAAYGKYADNRAKGDMLNKEINGDNDSIGIKTYTSPQLKNVVSDLTTGLASKNPEMEKRYTLNKLNTPAPTIPDGELEEEDELEEMRSITQQPVQTKAEIQAANPVQEGDDDLATMRRIMKHR